MPAPAFSERLTKQIEYEFAAAQQYIAVAVYYDSETLPRLAAFFYAQALEERNHAMMMIKYLMDADVAIEVPGVAAPKSTFKDMVEPIALALEQERRVSDQIAELAKIARDSGDYQSEQFMQWFLKEQVEEIATMSDLLRVVERSRDNALLAEEFLAREKLGQGTDGGAPAPTAAGGPV